MDRQLVQYLPNAVKVFVEMQGITDGQQFVVSKLWERLNSAFSDQFVESSTENGVRRWEAILKIFPKSTDTLETRKIRIINRMNENIPYTFRVLESRLTSISKDQYFAVNMDYNTYTLTIVTYWDHAGQIEELKHLLNVMIPANLHIVSTNEMNYSISGKQSIASGMVNCEVINLSDACNEILHIPSEMNLAFGVAIAEVVIISDAYNQTFNIPADFKTAANVSLTELINTQESR